MRVLHPFNVQESSRLNFVPPFLYLASGKPHRHHLGGGIDVALERVLSDAVRFANSLLSARRTNESDFFP